MKKRVYKTEFKSEAVRLSYQRENIKELAEELGVDVQRIYKWRSNENKLDSKNQRPKASQSISSEDYKKLQKQLKDTSLELEILKKAIHIFSKKGGSITNS
jgi:transposase